MHCTYLHGYTGENPLMPTRRFAHEAKIALCSITIGIAVCDGNPKKSTRRPADAPCLQMTTLAGTIVRYAKEKLDMKKLLCTLGMFVLIACTAHASPITIDFETVPFGAGLDGNTVTVDGVNFDGWAMGFGLAAGAALLQPTITFNPPVELLGFDYLAIPGAVCSLDATPFSLIPGVGTFHNPFSSNPIESLTFDFPSNLGGILLDNLTFEPQVAHTPIPGPLALLGIALAGFLGIRKKIRI